MTAWRPTDPDAPTFFYVVDWLPPDFGAVGQYAVIFAREIAETGRRVCLVGLTSGECNKRMEACAGRGMFEVKLIRAKPYRKTVLLSRLTWSFMTNLRLIWEVVGDPDLAVQKFYLLAHRRLCFFSRFPLNGCGGHGSFIELPTFTPKH